MSPLDQAISDASTAEATYNADVQNISTIQTAIDTATAPLAPAQSKMVVDAIAYNGTLDRMIAAATAAKVQVPVVQDPAPAPAPADPTSGGGGSNGTVTTGG